jgi:hypothetical protein
MKQNNFIKLILSILKSACDHNIEITLNSRMMEVVLEQITEGLYTCVKNI